MEIIQIAARSKSCVLAFCGASVSKPRRNLYVREPAFAPSEAERKGQGEY